MLNPIVMTIGWSLGAISLLLGIAAVYYMYKTSKTYGGKIGASLKNISIGTIIIIISLIVLGIILTIITQQLPEGENFNILILIAAFMIIGFMAILTGARNLLSVAKSK